MYSLVSIQNTYLLCFDLMFRVLLFVQYLSQIVLRGCVLSSIELKKVNYHPLQVTYRTLCLCFLFSAILSLLNNAVRVVTHEILLCQLMVICLLC